MSITLSASRQRQSKLLLCSFLRNLSTECNESPPPPPLPPQANEDSIITQATQHLLETPQNEWNSQLFSSSLSPRTLCRITRRLTSSSRALHFLQFLQSNSPPQDTKSLSSAFQAVLELASREPNWKTELFDLYNASKALNLSLSVNAATLLIRCFGRADMVDKSVIVYNELDPSIKNTHVNNVFVDVLLRDGRVDEALKLLDEMLEEDSKFPPNDVTGDIVFYGLTKTERLRKSISDEEIVALLSRFGKNGVFPKSAWLTQLITRLCRNGETCKAWDVLHESISLGAPLEVASCNALLAGLGRRREFQKMNDLMAKMKDEEILPNVVTFGILINHLCKFRRVDDALEVLGRMDGRKESDQISVQPDVIIYNTLIDGLCKVGRQEEGLVLMEQMRSQTGCAPNTVTYNCLIDGYCKSGEIERAHELFDQMNNEGVKANAITVSTLLDGMCRHGRINSAIQFFGQMQNKGIKGNAASYTILITAFCNVNNIDKAFELFDQMLKDGCSADAIVYYTLISGLSQAGRMDDASSVLLKLKEAGFAPDIVCYNVLLSGFCKKNKLDKVHDLLKEMQETGVKPDCITYNSLISYFSRIGNFKAARKVMDKMIKDGLFPTTVTYGALIHAYCLHGYIDAAMKIFRDMTSTSKVQPNTVIYNILIDSLCKNNDVELALSLMEDMKVKGVRPNTTTYNAMFKGLQERNWLGIAFKFMNKMIEQAVSPDYMTMEILTQWLSAVGETKKLKRFAQGYEISESTSTS